MNFLKNFQKTLKNLFLKQYFRRLYLTRSLKHFQSKCSFRYLLILNCKPTTRIFCSMFFCNIFGVYVDELFGVDTEFIGSS